MLGDALRPPFQSKSIDTVVTPWLIDIINADLPVLAARINNLLSADGRWLNFGSLAFAGAGRARRYSAEETRAIVAENGFAEPRVHEETIPYMCSPASRHGRQETVFSFAASKTTTLRNRAPQGIARMACDRQRAGAAVAVVQDPGDDDPDLRVHHVVN